MDGSGLSGPRRRPPEGGYARGAETRDRIIEAAFSVFADEGYLGASTRRIAAVAGVNPPALQYYFDSKEGLHRACGEAVIAQVIGDIAPVMDAARAALADGRRERVVEALGDLMVRLAEFGIAESDDEAWSRFLNRCQADDIGPAFEVIEEQISRPLKGVTIELVAHALGLSPDEPIVRLRALLLMSQVTAFHTHRQNTLAIVGWDDFTPERTAAASAVLRDHVRRLTEAG